MACRATVETSIHLSVRAELVGSKADLFDAVIKRRTVVMNEMRSTALREALHAAGGAPLPIDTLARAYVMPLA